MTIPCKAESAKFFPPGLGNRNQVRIQGTSLKDQATADDVQSKRVYDNGTESAPVKAKSIKMSLGTQCEATIGDYEVNNVYVRMKCASGSWTDWVQVEK